MVFQPQEAVVDREVVQDLQAYAVTLPGQVSRLFLWGGLVLGLYRDCGAPAAGGGRLWWLADQRLHRRARTSGIDGT